MWSRGFGSEETKAAFARAQRAGLRIRTMPTSDSMHIMDCGSVHIARRAGVGAGDCRNLPARSEPDGAGSTEVAAACRVLGTTCFVQGDFTEA